MMLDFALPTRGSSESSSQSRIFWSFRSIGVRENTCRGSNVAVFSKGMYFDGQPDVSTLLHQLELVSQLKKAISATK